MVCHSSGDVSAKTHGQSRELTCAKQLSMFTRASKCADIKIMQHTPPVHQFHMINHMVLHCEQASQSVH